MKSPNIIFMVYDSRSGSTFLSKLITKNIFNTIVTPEIGFEEILKRANQCLSASDWISIITKTINNNDLRHINSDFSGVIKRLKNMRGKIGAKKVFNLLVNESLQDFNHKENVIIKNGRHIKYIKYLSYLLDNDVQILFISRDPRAVISSKLLTKRPYFPYEVMAWGGALLAAIQWHKYYRYIEDAKQNKSALVCEVSYEELITDEDKELRKIAKFMGSQLNNTLLEKGAEYAVPSSEQSIHTLTSGKAVKDRINAWQKEISPYKIKQIESILTNDMRNKGYEPKNVTSSLNRLFIILLSLPELLFKTARHFSLRIKHKVLN